jgi:hypothetical protein
MTIPQHTGAGLRPRRIRATLIGLGFDGRDDDYHLTRGDQCLIVGGSEETHASLRETMLLMEDELDRMGQSLGDLDPAELADLAWRIDSPELHQIALQMQAGLERDGRLFSDLTPEELSSLTIPGDLDPLG